MKRVLNWKRILCLLIVVTLVFTSVETAYAKKEKPDKQEKKYSNHYKYDDYKDKDDYYHNCYEDNNYSYNYNVQEFKLNGSPSIKYGKYKLPLQPITIGMGATATFNKRNATLTIKKGNDKIVINFKKKTVKVNGKKDKNSGIFTAKNSNKTTAMIKYIAKILNYKVSFKGNKVFIEVSVITGNGGLNLPTNVTVSPKGATAVVANTLNLKNTHMTASAIITPGQAAGGRGELYVGSKLVATDSSISSGDQYVTFTTADYTPTNDKLRSKVPTGGVVTVKLYNRQNLSVTSAVGNPTLTVDYAAPTIATISSANYNATSHQLNITVSGAGAVGDKVDVSLITLTDTALNRSYRLTKTAGSGSTGFVNSSNSLLINIGVADQAGLSGFGSSTMSLTLESGSLLSDTAGNYSKPFVQNHTVPVTVTSSGLNQPTSVTVTPVGTTVVANTLNTTTQYLIATANITAGQAAGGKAELYVGSKLVATDTSIASNDTVVMFTTADYSPTNAKLKEKVPNGGVVTVKLYNKNNNSVISTVANPTLIVDYIAPTITGITSATYDYTNGKLYLVGTGINKVGDIVDVTKITLYDSTYGRTYQLANQTNIGSKGVVYNANSLFIDLGYADKLGLSGFDTTTIFLTVSEGSLLKDAAGNTSIGSTTTQTIPVLIVK